MTTLPTASELPRVAVCIGSAVLPRVSTVSPYAQAGDARHQFLHHASKWGRERALELVPLEWQEACSRIEVERLPIHLESEVTFAYHLGTRKARILGMGLNRDYSKADPDEVCGTADVFGSRMLEDDVLEAYVPDYKGPWARIGRARDHWQVKFLAMAAAKAIGASCSRTELIRLGDDGEPDYDSATFDSVQLEMIEEEFLELMRAVLHERQRLLTAVSDWIPPLTLNPTTCRNCPSFRFCPAQRTLIAALAGDPKAFVGGIMADLQTLELAPTAYARWRQAKLAMEVCEKDVQALAHDTPLPGTNGKLFTAAPLKSLVIDAIKATAVLKEHFRHEVATLSVKPETSQAAIEQAFRAVNGPKGATTCTKDAVDLLLAAGAAKYVWKERFGEYSQETLETRHAERQAAMNPSPVPSMNEEEKGEGVAQGTE